MVTAEALHAIAAAGAWPTAREIRRAFRNHALIERRAYRCRGRRSIECLATGGDVLHVSVLGGLLVVYAASAESADAAARSLLGHARLVGGDRVPLESVARAPGPRHFLVMLVLGLGCTALAEKDVEGMRVRMERRLGLPVRVFCDRSLSRTLLGIGKAACAMRPSGSSAMVKQVLGWAEHYTKVGFDVVLIGHSYGGSVVAACAEGLQRRNPRLHMVTLGSIYVPPPQRTPFAEIKHVMNVGDIAMKCNGLDPDRDGSYVEFKQGSSSKRPSLSQRWALHRKYSVDDAVRGVVGATP